MKTAYPFKSRIARVYTRPNGTYRVKIRAGERYVERTFHEISEANKCARNATKEAEKNGASWSIPLNPRERAILAAFRESVASGNNASDVAAAAIAAIHRRAKAKIPAASLIGLFIEATAARGNASRIQRLRSRLETFVAALPSDEISEATPQAITEAIANTTGKLSYATARDWIVTIRAFIRFACERSGISVPTIRVPAREKPRNRIETLSNARIPALLAQAKILVPEFLPAIVLQLFCGLRASEALRLRCGDIRHNEVFLSREITKTAQARRVPIPANAREFLSALAEQTTTTLAVAPHIGGAAKREQAYAVALRTLGNLPRNVLRKTAISNYCALVGNAKAADYCGNTIAAQGEYYRDLKSLNEADEYFKIAIPSAPQAEKPQKAV